MEFPIRKHPRLKNYDYATPNYYFVTICTHQKKCIFWNRDKVNRFGQIAEEKLLQIPNHYSNIAVDKYVIMPNHMHAILVLENSTNSLPKAIGQYKASVTRKIRKIDPKIIVWQTSFHDHIIRNECGYQKIWNYIDTNPAKWKEDCFYSSQE